jgi:hypothetical protein
MNRQAVAHCFSTEKLCPWTISWQLRAEIYLRTYRHTDSHAIVKLFKSIGLDIYGPTINYVYRIVSYRIVCVKEDEMGGACSLHGL